MAFLHIVFSLVGSVALGIVLLLIATVVFDILHFFLHQCAKSGQPLLRALGSLHTTHHQFLDSDLHIHENLAASNVFRHVLPEFVVQLAVTLALVPLFPAPAVWVALVIELAVFVFIMWGKPGFDVNHKYVEQLKAYRPLYFCVPEYHLLHHAYPTAYFSSWIKTLDHLLCTGTALQGRCVLLTDTKSDFSSNFAHGLKKAGAKIENELSDAAMQRSDILVLCHKPKTDGDYENTIGKFVQLHQHRRLPVEVWVLAADNELSDATLSAYARFAKQLFGSEQVIYRHLVASENMSGVELANIFLKRIRRGFNYVPSRYNLAMLKHYWRFIMKR